VLATPKTGHRTGDRIRELPYVLARRRSRRVRESHADNARRDDFSGISEVPIGPTHPLAIASISARPGDA